MGDLQKLVLLGVGACNSDLVDSIREINGIRPTYELLGYLTSDGTPKPARKHGLECLGAHAYAREMPGDIQFVGIWGGAKSFWRIPDFFSSLGLGLDRFETVIHPRAYVSPQSSVGRGSVILGGTMVGVDVRIGNWVTLLQNVTLSHDDVVEDCCIVTCGATCSGRVQIGYNCFIGTNVAIVDGARVGRRCLIGAGALIRHDVPDGEIWVGNPGRRLHTLDEWRQLKGV